MSKNVYRAAVVAALMPLASVPAAAALAAGTGTGSTTAITTPAPDGDASAVAAQVDGILTVGGTSAHAGHDGGTASGDALDLLGQRVSGGDQKGVGESSGALLATGDTPVGHAEVAPWSAKVTDDGGGYQAMAEAALAHVDLAEIAELWLLHSQSKAGWAPGASSGDAESDGAELSLLEALDVKVLHSEAHSNGTGESDLLVVNGSAIGSSDDANGACELDASPLLHLLCLQASGGTGADGVTSAASDVLTADIGDGALTGTISGSSSQGGSAAPAATPAESGSGTVGEQRGGGRVPSTATSEAAGLPYTGDESRRLAAIAGALVALGGAMLAFVRRSRATFAG